MRRLADKRIQFSAELKSKKDLLAGIGYPCLCLTALLLSVCFPMAEKQLIVISLIAGIRWIGLGKSNEVNVIILERR